MVAIDPMRDPPSEVELANVALGLLGARSISSFSDGTVEAITARLHYYNARDELLESYTWDFAVLLAQLAVDATAPLFDRGSAFALPADFLRLFGPFREALSFRDWVIQSGFVYTNDSAPLNFRYVAQINDATRFSPLFRKALALQLASKMCEALTQSTSKKESLEQEYDRTIAQAKRTKAIQAPPIDSPTDEWLLAREGGSDIPPVTGSVQ